ncbi:hypothetical protein Bbelb_269400 [Branchiostoma belcheri]|nr:hypothetical protein Bbelb_269400 [Branchiostoma belcheri]
MFKPSFERAGRPRRCHISGYWLEVPGDICGVVPGALPGGFEQPRGLGRVEASGPDSDTTQVQQCQKPSVETRQEPQPHMRWPAAKSNLAHRAGSPWSWKFKTETGLSLSPGDVELMLELFSVQVESSFAPSIEAACP